MWASKLARLLSVVFLTVCEDFAASQPHVFRAGVIMVEKSVLPFKMEMVGPALDMAMEVAETEYNIRFQTFLRLYPEWCNSVFTSGAVADLYHRHNISVLIGPGCSGDITVCGKLATFYRLPQVTGVGDLVLDKETYPTLTRLSYSLEKQSGFLTAVLYQFEWRHVTIIFDTNDVLMHVQGNALRAALREDPSLPRPYDIEFDTTKNPNFESILLEASQHSRVILFLSSGGDLRNFMLTAFDLGMTQNGDYAFITIELFQSEAWGDFSWKRGDRRDGDAKAAFESLLFITLTVPSGPTWQSFANEVIMRAERDYNFTYQEEDVPVIYRGKVLPDYMWYPKVGSLKVNYFVGAFYDSVIYLARALNHTLEDGEDPYDGISVAQKLWNSTFSGIMGDVFVDSIGDRIADYSLLDMTQQDSGTFEIVARYYGARGVYEPDSNHSIHWPGTGRPPLDIPYCGFMNDDQKCSKDKVIIIAISCIAGALLLVIVVGSHTYRRFRFESALSNMSWQVKWDEIVISKGRSMNSMSRLSLAALSEATTKNSSLADEDGINQIFTKIGSYNGSVVAIRKFQTQRFDINRRILLELKMMRDSHHDNLTRFVGACVEPMNVSILTEYCPKGSLEDILANEAIKLDWMFRYSLINDIIRGMIYLHDSPFKFHGRLKSSNCVVDSRFVLKVTDFGLPSFYSLDEGKESFHLHYRRLLWTAPELISSSVRGTQQGDVFSFGIILQEIISRCEPYEDYDSQPQDIIKRVQSREVPPFRPKLDPSLCSRPLVQLTEACWAEQALARPSFIDIKNAMKTISKESRVHGNILDNLLQRMEQYAENLESLVEDRTKAFLDEKKKSEELLYRVLPRSVAETLKQGKSVPSEAFECVTIYFSDIVGFTAISAASTPMQVVDLLNDLYTCFDAVIDQFDVYKVETIGDAYMVCSGVPIKNGNEHARQVSRMSLALLEEVNTFKIRHQPNTKLKLRIGLHSGPVCAGVVGLTMPRYCLFGDTVNTASRMESNGEPLRIHVSSSTRDILQRFGSFKLILRGEVPMKGKGLMTTYWLEGEYPN